ncbi:hypothetical protein [Levilactobacillus sp. N40-8-2]|uniref:hypothetical protein n=1 Tax=Levilactobacillus muriae TaxID=3238987 RepID=UPI0038B3CF3B
MRQLQESARQSLIIRTVDNPQALQVLLSAGYPVKQRGNDLILTEAVALTSVLQAILGAHIQILKVNQHQEDLETVLLRLLAERKD